MKRTKIVCTIGPATAEKGRLRELFAAGMNVARLNFSHGSHDWHAERIRLLRELESEEGRPIAILQDLCGPKLRIGEVPQDGIELLPGRECLLSTESFDPGPPLPRIPIPLAGLLDALQVGGVVYMDDAQIELEVLGRSRNGVRCRVQHGGRLLSRKGITTPGASFQIDSLTEKDLRDAAFGIAAGVDYIGVSFVRQASDMDPVRALIADEDADTRIIAKIEKPEALVNLSSILSAADGLMVARGDLGVEVPLHQLPILQKEIIRAANAVGKPVITATQMLESMILNPRPTRAEVTDVANAIFDGTSAVMLSGETAMGKFPVETVRMMAATAEYAEAHLPYQRLLQQAVAANATSRTEAITQGVTEIAVDLDAVAILCSTSSGETARQFARMRSPLFIIAGTSSIATYRRLALLWGISPVLVPETTNGEERIAALVQAARSAKWILPGQTVAIATGISVGTAGGTNGFRMETI
ncbi:MAG: pyruvate kinase [Planctomycetaceae bacterium]|nr:pyruvate kinase [Planctomycetaceae bacterium]